MPGTSRTSYEIDLSARPPTPEGSGPALRPLAADDRTALASLMLDAYRGTIDDEGESIDDALHEVDGWLGDGPLLEHCRGAVVGGELASAVLVMTVEEAPFIAIVMTGAAHKGQGLGRAVVEAALSSLAGAGHERVGLVITDGNVPSERLFAGLGAVQRPGPGASG